jgi:uncharacterized membrane protein YphA (DoxX/SURF4 family)
MENTKNPSEKRNKIIYWIATLWLASGMVATGVQQLMKMNVDGALAPPGVFGITKLGYPVYILTLIGIWKILGVTAMLVPKFPLLKEWTYAGFFFLLTGALFSHIAVGHGMSELFPSFLLLVLTVLSWYFRPAGRKIMAVA